jgi:biopolymer transport protein ExbD
VKADGTFYVERDIVAREGLENAIKALIRKKTVGDDKNVTLTVAADKAAVIDNVVFILDIANRLKVKTILATNPPEKVAVQ